MSPACARRRRGPVFGLGIALGLTLAATIAAPVSAANNVVVLAYFGDCQFAGSHAGASKTVKIDWRDSDGNLKSKHSVTSNSAGNFLSRCEFGEEIETGDVLKTTIGTSVRSFSVPKLSLVAFRNTDQVGGSTDPGVDVYVAALTFDGSFSSNDAVLHSAAVTADGGGGFMPDSLDWDSPPDLKGWDVVLAERTTARGDAFVLSYRVQGILAWLNRVYFDVVGYRGLELIATLTRGSTEIGSGHVWTNRFGSARGEFLDGSNDPVRAKVGDVVEATFATDAHLTLPTITATIAKSTDRVTASCGLPNVGVEVDVHTRDLSKYQSRVGFTNGSNVYVANFATAPAYNIVSGDKVDVYCKLATGDIVAKTFTVL